MGNKPSRYDSLREIRETEKRLEMTRGDGSDYRGDGIDYGGDGADRAHEEIGRPRVKERVRPARILLLGTARSGKTTLFKQRQLIYGGGWTKRERQDYEEILSVDGIVQEVSRILDIMCSDHTLDTATNKRWTEALNPFEMAAHSADTLEEMKADQYFLEALPRNGLSGPLMDSLPYFLDLVRTMAWTHPRRYSPTNDDILRVYFKTIGITTSTFTMENIPIELYHVGGARSERKKWPMIPQAGSADAILFCVSLASYYVIEDMNENGMDQSLDVFTSMVHAPSLKAVPICLCFTKLDIFSEKLVQIPLTTRFPDYRGGSDVGTALDYIKAQFLARMPTDQMLGSENRVTIHCINALDTDNARSVFSALCRILS